MVRAVFCLELSSVPEPEWLHRIPPPAKGSPFVHLGAKTDSDSSPGVRRILCANYVGFRAIDLNTLPQRIVTFIV